MHNKGGSPVAFVEFQVCVNWPRKSVEQLLDHIQVMSTYQSTDNPDGSVKLIKLFIDLSTFHTFKIIIFRIVLVLDSSEETNFIRI